MGTHREPTWASSVAAMPRKDKIILSVTAIAAVLLLFGLYSWGTSRQAPSAVASGTVVSVSPPPVAEPSSAPSVEPVAGVDPSQAPAPGMVPSLAPPDGPALDSPPFDVDAVAMRDELRTHGVDLPDDKLGELVRVADKYIAEGKMDLQAWDPRIMRDVRTLWPGLDRDHVIDVTRCTAEYIERVLARNAGLPHPPDEDDHAVVVDGRGEQPRVGDGHSHGN